MIRKIMANETIKKLPLNNILSLTNKYLKANWQKSCLYTIIAYLIMAVALFSWKSVFFWPVIVLMYVLWGVFFRYYLGRKPYFDLKPFIDSMIPSTKIVMLSVIICSALIILPFIPLFVSNSVEFNENYSRFLQGDIDNQGMLILITSVLFVFASPIIAYRPFLAWISSLCGRTGSLRMAWNKTKGNYAEFLLIAIITNLSISVIRWMIMYFGGNDYATLLFLAPIVIYFNVVAAETYRFFFLDVE